MWEMNCNPEKLNEFKKEKIVNAYGNEDKRDEAFKYILEGFEKYYSSLNYNIISSFKKKRQK